MASKPGEYVIENLMKSFIKISYIKLDDFIKNDREMSIRKGMKYNDDIEFQNLLQTLNACAENSLPCLMKALLDWHTNNHSQGKILFKASSLAKIDKTKLPDVCVSSDINAIDSSVISSPNIISESIVTTGFVDGNNENVHNSEKRDLGVDYIFCQSLISILKQLYLHPGHDEMINNVLMMAFKHFQTRDDLLSNPNNFLINDIADMYAEVVGVLSQSRFFLVKIKFSCDLKALRSKETSSYTSQSIISLLMGMKFFRVKMYPIEDFVDCFNFLTDLANYFLETDDKKIKHALAGLLVEVLLPVAAVVKNEVNIPVLKSFVDLLYNTCLDMCSRKKHFTALSPLVTCLLSVSQKQFFLNNWPNFMVICLNQLRNRDPNSARVSLESLFRLLWVYIVRIKGEKHADTQSKLYSIVNSLFPRGSKTVVPRDASTNIFVKIIHFIAQEKLDFAMDIIFDLIGANRSVKGIYPERMNIGLCAFLLIALSLQQKQGEPPMPQKSNSDVITSSTIAFSQTLDGSQALPSPYHLSQNSRVTRQNKVLSSSAISTNSTAATVSNNAASDISNQTTTAATTATSQQVSRMTSTKRKSSYAFMSLNDTNAATIGSYINPIRKAFDTMLKLLDQQVIRTMLLTKQENFNKESDDVITTVQSSGFISSSFNRKSKRASIIDAERKPKIDLLKTCISAIPRLLPSDMSKSEIVDLLSRLSIHIDEELRIMAHQALISIIQEFPSWRFKTVQTFLNFVRKEISDSSVLQLESSMKILYHLLNSWKNALISANKETNQKSRAIDRTLLNDVEGFCLVMLCQYRSSIRRLSVHILKEIKVLITHINMDLKTDDNENVSDLTDKCDHLKLNFAIDTMDQTAPIILEKCLPFLPTPEKCHLISLPNLDFMTFAERTNLVWGVVSNIYPNSVIDKNPASLIDSKIQTNLWNICIATIFSRSFLLKSSPNSITNAWPFLMERIYHLFAIIDPSAQIAENRTSSILRGGSGNKKPLSISEREHCMLLWQNYIMTACCIAPMSLCQTILTGKAHKSSPDQSGSVIDNSLMKVSSSALSSSSLFQKPTSKELMKLLVPLIKCEVSDIRDSVMDALGHFNPLALRDMIDEIGIFLRESVDKKQENVRRRRRKDSLRFHLVRILELLAYNGIFDYSDDQSNQINTVIDWVEQLKHYLIGDLEVVGGTSDSSMKILDETRLHFCRLIQFLILHAPREKRQSLFSDVFKQHLFELISNWIGVFNKPLSKRKWRSSNECSWYKIVGLPSDISELCYSAITTMCSLLCCGQIFDSQYLQENGCVLYWIVNIINCGDERLMSLCEETVSLLLDYNSETHTTLDIMVDSCYTESNEVAKIIFLAIVRTFNNNPDYPCDYVSMVIIALSFTSHIDTQIRENALQLFQLLFHRFFIDSLVYSQPNNEDFSPHLNTSTNSSLSTMKSVLLSKWEQIPLLNQDEISKEMAETLPDLTLSIFSEITQKIQCANCHMQNVLLNCLVPWMYNLELIDFLYSQNSTSVSSESSKTRQKSSSPVLSNKQGLLGNGWGSKQATELVLNNLFYLTVKFGCELNRTLEILWACLIKYRTENLSAIIHYLIMITSLAPKTLLPFAKQIIVYLAKEKPKKVIENLFYTLQTIDGVNYAVEKTQTMPFFRLSFTGNNIVINFQNSIRGNRKCKTDNESGLIDTNDKSVMNNSQQLPAVSVRSSTLDSVQNSFYSESTKIENTNYPQSAPGTLRITEVNELDKGNMSVSVIDEDKYATLRPKDLRKTGTKIVGLNQNKQKNVSINLIHPLPLPAYGGYFAPLDDFLNKESCPTWPHNYKSSIALMLFVDLIPLRNTRSFWERDIELLLHCIILGLDHKEYLVYEQCKILLLKILSTLCPDQQEFKLLNLLMIGSNAVSEKSYLCKNGGACKTVFRMPNSEQGISWNSFSEEFSPNNDASKSMIADEIDTKLQRTLSSYSVTSTVTLIPSSKISNGQTKFNALNSEKCDLESKKNCNVGTDTINHHKKCVDDFIKIIHTNPGRPLWNYEDVTTSRYINEYGSFMSQCGEKMGSETINPNCADINANLNLIPSVGLMNGLIQLICNLIDIDGTLSIKWAQLALNTGVNCTHRHYASRSLQIFRALHVAYDGIKFSTLFSRLLDTIGDQNEDVQSYVIELLLTIEQGINNINLECSARNFSQNQDSSDVEDEIYRSTPNLKNPHSPKIVYQKNPSRSRGTTIGEEVRISKSFSNHHKRSSAIIESPVSKLFATKRSTNSQKFELSKSSSHLSWDERTDLICELFWLSNILLESDNDHEFFAGVRFLNLLSICLSCNQIDLRTKLEKTNHLLNWTPVFPGTIQLLIKGCISRNLSNICSQLLSKLVLNVKNLLIDPSQKYGFPFAVITLLVTIFDEETPYSRLAAKNIAYIAKNIAPDRLANLITVMQLYSGGTFNKDHSQWTRCVVKYLYDGFSEYSSELLSFINRLLLECPSPMHTTVLQILSNLINYVNMNDVMVISNLNVIIENLSQLFINSNQWKDVCPILRLIVARNSSFGNPNNHLQNSVLLSMPMVPLPEAEAPKLELPGRVLDYQFDVTAYCKINPNSKSPNTDVTDDSNSSVKRTNNNMKTKELLLQLINSFGIYGYRIGFPKSPSVIFSQSTETLEHQVSLHSSSETTSTNDISAADDLRLDDTSSIEQAQVFRDLDEYLDSQLKMNFLDLPDDKWEDERKPSWGVRSQSITHYCDFPDATDISNKKTFSVYGDPTDNRSGYLTSPSKTMPCRSPKSPMSKAMGGPSSSITSPHMSRGESSVFRPQSLSFINSIRGVHTGKGMYKTNSETRHSKHLDISVVRSVPNNRELKKTTESKSDDFDFKIRHNSLSSDEDMDWSDRKQWTGKLKPKPLTSSSSEESDDEDDVDEDELICRNELNNSDKSPIDQKGNFRLSSFDRSNSNTYEKEIEYIWCETLSKALDINHNFSESSAASEVNTPTLSNLWTKFPILFDDCCSKCRLCIIEANYYLSMVKELSHIGSEFVEIITGVCKYLRPPLFYFGDGYLSYSTSLIQSQKLSLIQLQETYDKFCNHIDYSAEILDLLKRSTRIIQSQDYLRLDEKRVNLCRQLQKMMTQLILMFQSHCRFLWDFKDEILLKDKSVKDASVFIQSIASKLDAGMKEMQYLKTSVKDLEARPIGSLSDMQQVEKELYNTLLAESIDKALSIWRANRVGIVMFNKALEADNPTFYIMQMFCQLYARDHPNMLVYVVANQIFSDAYGPDNVDTLVVSLVSLSGSITNIEKELNCDSPKKTNAASTVDIDPNTLNVTSDSSVL